MTAKIMCSNIRGFRYSPGRANKISCLTFLEFHVSDA